MGDLKTNKHPIKDDKHLFNVGTENETDQNPPPQTCCKTRGEDVLRDPQTTRSCSQFCISGISEPPIKTLCSC